MRVLAVIAARAGSKGLPGKNVRKLGGVPLIAWTVKAAKKARTLDAAWVSTDGAAIAKAAKAAGGTVPFRRPARLATDRSSIVDALKHAVSEFEKTNGRADVIVLLQASTPLRTAKHVDATVKAVLRGADSAQTVALDEHHPLHKFTLAGGRLKPMFKTGGKAANRQQAPAIYRPNGGVYAARRDLVMKKGTLRGKDHRGIVMDFESSVDIDTLWDFKLAEAIVAETGRKP
jgi:CMP-N,N'-diacetyllegionaminic acid synthase